MSSGNETSAGHVTYQDDTSENRELESVKIHLEQVMRKNQDLKKMLLFTTQELEKEKENSRKIVQTLTERLMESREMINKLEVENMRYKKDCMLAVELLQCNRGVDKDHVDTVVKKLSDYTQPIAHPPYPTEKRVAKHEKDGTNITNKTAIPDEKRDVHPSRPRTLSKKKTKSEASTEDTTALLAKKEGNEPEILGQGGGLSTQKDKIHDEKYHKDLGEKQCEKKQEKSRLCALPSTINNSKQKQCDEGRGIGKERMNLKGSVNIGRLAKGDQQEGERLIANDQSENTNSQVDEYRIEPNGEGETYPKSEYSNDELSREDKPLIINETETLIQQHFDTPKEWGNVNSREEKPEAINVCSEEGKDPGHGLQSSVIQSTSLALTSTIGENKDIYHVNEMQEDTVDDEHDKLIVTDGKRSEEEFTRNFTKTQHGEV